MILALALLLSGAVEPAVPKKGVLYLAEAIESSTFICIGTEIESLTVQVPREESEDASAFGATPASAPLGVIRVERVLKGDASTEFVHHETWSSWTCDETGASIGRRAIYFLGPGIIAQRPPSQRAPILNSLRARTVYRNVGSGDGIVTITNDADRPWVSFNGAPNVLRPRRDPTSDDPAVRSANEWEIPLAAFVGYVEDLCRFDSAALAIHARVFEPARSREKPFDLRILPNGDARLAIGSDVKEVVRTFTLEPAAWNDLSMELFRLAQNGYVDAGEHADRLRRSLRVSVGNRAIRFSDPSNFSTSLTRRDSLRTAVQAWALVRASFDCAECADFRAADKLLLGG